MNKKHSLYFGVAALLLAAIFTLAGCGDDGGGGGGTTTYIYTSSDAAGNTYILAVTGDSYELTIKYPNGTEQKSTGGAVLGEGGAYTLAPSGNPDATITVGTSGNGIGGITGPITPDGGGDPITPPTGQLDPAKTITITGLAPYAQYGVKGNAVVTLYSSLPYYPIAAGYANISGDTVEAALKSVPSDFDFNDFDEEPSLAEVVNLIKGFPDAWTGSDSYYVMLWANAGMATSYNKISFTTANTTVEFSESNFDFD
ncbi:MAG: hypothetical protein LBK05_09915 [Treponema sp.]|jgi:hypothetical protein|nr:hypothetical protein [Treponema sp.]